MANLYGGIETDQEKCFSPYKTALSLVAVCFSDHESASLAEMHWTGKMVNAPAPVSAEDTHLKFHFIKFLISCNISQGRAGIPCDR